MGYNRFLVFQIFCSYDVVRCATIPYDVLNFSPVLMENELNFSPVLVHSLLQCKIEETTCGEIHFGLGGKRVRFGRLEYSLICGLSYEDGPSKNERDQRTSDRLITEHERRGWLQLQCIVNGV